MERPLRVLCCPMDMKGYKNSRLRRCRVSRKGYAGELMTTRTFTGAY